MSLASRLRKRTRAWARRRHGVDSEPHTITARRTYILPTRLGLFYAGMVFLMFLGSMNYANNLALALTFILGSIGLVAMHHCQRNLVGVRVGSAPTTSVFAGETAYLGIALASDAERPRYDITVAVDTAADSGSVHPTQHAVLRVPLATTARGRLQIDHLQISSAYPFGLFRAWTHVHMPLTCVIYPKLAARQLDPPLASSDRGNGLDARRGDEDFAGLREFTAGDSPRRIAWKAYARGQDLQVKQYAGAAATSQVLDFDDLTGLDIEARLSQLARWIEDAHQTGRAYGLRLPSVYISPGAGGAHRDRCLTALALFGEPSAADSHARAA